MSRPSRMTPALEAIFDEQAQIHARKKSLKDLSGLTGFAPSYCWEQIHNRLVKIRVSENKSVSRETDTDTLSK